MISFNRSNSLTQPSGSPKRHGKKIIGKTKIKRGQPSPLVGPKAGRKVGLAKQDAAKQVSVRKGGKHETVSAQPTDFVNFSSAGSPPKKKASTNIDRTNTNLSASRVPSGDDREGRARRKAGGRSGSLRRQSKRPQKRGGWPKTKFLTWDEVKDIDQIGHLFRKAGKPLNAFLTIKPSGSPVTDATYKKACYREAQNVAAKLRRRGVPCIGVRVFEKTPGGVLHMHMLIHVPPEWIREVCGWTNRPVLDIKPAAQYHMQYITKQRRSLSPEAERNIRRRRQRGAPFTGRRWSLTKAAKGVLNTV
jgi:hypothetical protein